jgi:hypothetical protein
MQAQFFIEMIQKDQLTGGQGAIVFCEWEVQQNQR